MIKYILHSVVRRKERSGLIIIGVALFAALYIIFAAASSEITVTSDANLNQYWRTTYDILVRHPDHLTEIEESYGLVEANHLSGTPGGITFEQYKAILNIDDVEIAAPIAMLGYLEKNPIRIGIRDPFPKGIYQVTVTSQISDGINDHVMTLPGPYYYYYQHSFEPDKIVREQINQNLNRLNLFIGGSTDGWGFTVDLPRFDDKVLVAAIDPEQEAKLINIDSMVVDRDYLPVTTDVYYNRVGSPIVPVLLNIQDYIKQSVTIKIEQLNLTSFHDSKNTFVDSLDEISGPDELESASLNTVWEYTVPIRREWNQVGLVVNISNGKVMDQSSSWLSEYKGYLIAPDAVDYILEENPPFFTTSDTIILHAISKGLSTTEEDFFGSLADFFSPSIIASSEQLEWKRSPEVLFRESIPRHNELTIFEGRLQGTFMVEDQIALGKMSPNQVPLETYRPPLAILRYDEKGNTVPETILSPTLNYFGYLTAPPDLLIRLSDAYAILEKGCLQYLQGDGRVEANHIECPETDKNIISAIRVRVNDVDELTPNNQAKIELVAQEIYELTGLHVDIMVGSSPQSILVHIPGYEDVSGLGYVEEYWVKKGVSTLLLSGLNKADKLLFGALFVVCLFYIFNFNYLSVMGRMHEFAVLLSIGWRRSAVFGIILVEATIIGLVSGLFSALIALFIISQYSLNLPQSSVLSIIPLGGIVYLVGNVLPAWKAAKTLPIEVLKKGETRQSKRVPGGSSLLSYAFGGLFRRPGRTIGSIIGIGVSSAFIVYLKLTIDGLDGNLYGTLLGEWIRTQIRPLHIMMGLIALIVSAMGIGLIMILNYVSRRKEIGLLLSIGWLRKHLFSVFLIESGLLGLFGGVVGTAIAFITNAQNFSHFESTLFWVLPAMIGLGLPTLVSILAAYYPALTISKMTPIDAFRGDVQIINSDAKSRGVFGFVLISSVTIIMVVSLFWDMGLAPNDNMLAGGAEILPSPTALADLAAPGYLPTATPINISNLPSYDIEMVFDRVSNAITAKESIHIINHTDLEWDTIVLNLYPNQLRYRNNDIDIPAPLVIHSLLLNNQSPKITVNDENSILTINLDSPLRPNDEALIEIDFENTAQHFRNQLGDLYELSAFYPLLAVRMENGWHSDICDLCRSNTYSESANYQFSIDLPPNWQIAATGELTKSELTQFDSRIHTFTADSVREIALIVSPDLVETSLTIQGIDVSIFTIDGEKNINYIQDELEKIIPTFEKMVGDYPFRSLDVAVISKEYNTGKARPGTILLFQNDNKDEVSYNLALNIARQWWGGALGNDRFSHPWINNSLSIYVALQLLDTLDENDFAVNKLKEIRTNYDLLSISNNEIFLDSNSSAYDGNFKLFNDITQSMGVVFFATLHEIIGDEAFFIGLQELYIQHKNGIITPDDLLSAFQQASGKDLLNMFIDWGAIIP